MFSCSGNIIQQPDPYFSRPRDDTPVELIQTSKVSSFDLKSIEQEIQKPNQDKCHENPPNDDLDQRENNDKYLSENYDLTR